MDHISRVHSTIHPNILPKKYICKRANNTTFIITITEEDLKKGLSVQGLFQNAVKAEEEIHDYVPAINGKVKVGDTVLVPRWKNAIGIAKVSFIDPFSVHVKLRGDKWPFRLNRDKVYEQIYKLEDGNT